MWLKQLDDGRSEWPASIAYFELEILMLIFVYFYYTLSIVVNSGTLHLVGAKFNSFLSLGWFAMPNINVTTFGQWLYSPQSKNNINTGAICV